MQLSNEQKLNQLIQIQMRIIETICDDLDKYITHNQYPHNSIKHIESNKLRLKIRGIRQTQLYNLRNIQQCELS